MGFVTAASALRRLPPFTDVSLRLLQDLVEFASDFRRPSTGNPAAHPLWLVLDGILEVRRGAGVPRRVAPGRVYLTRPGDTAFCPVAGREARTLAFERQWLDEAVACSFTLARTLGDGAADLFSRGAVAAKPPAHQLFLTASSDVAAPLTAMAELLAIGIAEQFPGEHAAVVVLDAAGLTISAWQAAGWLRLGLPGGLAASAIPADQLVGNILATIGVPANGEPWHLIFVHPQNPQDLPDWWRRRQWFHRIVYLTRAWDLSSGAAPEVARCCQLLLPDLYQPGGAGPYFSSFVPTVVGLPTPKPASLREWLPPPIVEGLETLETTPLPDPVDVTTPPGVSPGRWRLFRDRCRVHLDVDSIQRAWIAGPRGNVSANLMRSKDTRREVERWARAVTNRQVGVALSGGGASSAVLIPMLRRIADSCPIDVVGGVSGGTLLGAYLCHDNPGGLTTYCRDGWWFLFGLGASVVHSVVVERALDRLLTRARVEDLGTRLVAVTTRLTDDAPPQPSAVVKGTLGEAVRVSGAAAGMGPSDSGRARYLDGGSALPVPARALPDFGADVVFAFNSIATTSGRNLLRFFTPSARLEPIADFVYRNFFVGRAVDGLVTFFALLHQASRDAAEEADVFFEVLPQTFPILDGFNLPSVGSIAQHAADNPSVWSEACRRCEERWSEFSRAASRRA